MMLLDPHRTGPLAQWLEDGLRSRIAGQDEAVRQIVNMYQTFLTGLNPPGRPVGSFLFLGPTGSGKTRIVEATAETLLGDARAVLKVDCAEFQHSHEIAKLIGSPPGYLGHRETLPLLCQENLNLYQTEDVKLSFVLFDEIEKASDAVWNLLLGILDKGVLRLGDNRKVDFCKAMIFMTSNLGAAEMESLRKPRLGFATAVGRGERHGLDRKIAAAGTGAARRKFTPEFINRIDKMVVFQPLGEPELRRILEIELGMVEQRVCTDCEAPFAFTVTEAAKRQLLAEGSDERYGARHLKRAIERLIVHPLSNLVASGQVAHGDSLRIDFEADGKEMVFAKEAGESGPAQLWDGAPIPTTRAAMADAPADLRCGSVHHGIRAPLGEVSFGE